MKKFLTLACLGSALLISACAHEVAPDMRAESFMRADLNHNGLLSYGEYQDYLNLQAQTGDLDAQQATTLDQPKREKNLLLKFQGLDTNRDTFVSREELAI